MRWTAWAIGARVLLPGICWLMRRGLALADQCGRVAGSLRLTWRPEGLA